MTRRVAITGAAGQLGRELVRAFSQAGNEVLGLSRPDLDVTHPDDLDRLVEWRPEVVVNSAAWTDVDGCARNPARAMLVNGTAAGAVAGAAMRADALIIQISTNEVFDGTRNRPYDESDSPNPLNPYGASKLAGERLVAEANPRHLIIRTSWLFGPTGQNFVTKIIDAAKRARAAGESLRVVADEWGNPTWAPVLADSVVALNHVSVPPLLHLAGEPPVTRLAWARSVLEAVPVEMEAIRLSDYDRPSRVPGRAVLSMSLAAACGIRPFFWEEPSRRLAHELT